MIYELVAQRIALFQKQCIRIAVFLFSCASVINLQGDTPIWESGSIAEISSREEVLKRINAWRVLNKVYSAAARTDVNGELAMRQEIYVDESSWKKKIYAAEVTLYTIRPIRYYVYIDEKEYSVYIPSSHAIVSDGHSYDAIRKSHKVVKNSSGDPVYIGAWGEMTFTNVSVIAPGEVLLSATLKESENTDYPRVNLVYGQDSLEIDMVIRVKNDGKVTKVVQKTADHLSTCKIEYNDQSLGDVRLNIKRISEIVNGPKKDMSTKAFRSFSEALFYTIARGSVNAKENT